ncbi:MAG: type II secretion system protein [Verrucomicrobiota bacterium]
MVIPKVAHSPLSGRCRKQSGRKGFTLVELLVVITVIAVLASLLMPALSKAKAKANTAICLNNKRQLNVAWIAYSSDHDDKLAMNSVGSNPGFEVGISWVTGQMAWHVDVRDNTNSAYLTQDEFSSLARYLGRSAKVFKCPADNFLMKEMRALGWEQRVRSVSMNYFLGAGSDAENARRKPSPPHNPVFVMMSEIRRPSALINFIDEHPDSIDEKTFSVVTVVGSYSLGFPGNYHQKGAVFSFTDGHARLKRWTDGYRNVAVKFKGQQVTPTSVDGKRVEGTKDHTWLSDHLGEKPSAQSP